MYSLFHLSPEKPKEWVPVNRALPVVEAASPDRLDDLVVGQPELLPRRLVAERRAPALPIGIEVVYGIHPHLHHESFRGGPAGSPNGQPHHITAPLPGLGECTLERLTQDLVLVSHPDPLLGVAPLLGQDPPSQVPHPRIRVLEEPAELRPASARDVEAVVQEALDVALALPVLALLRGQVRALAAEVAGMVAAGEPLVRPHAPAAPAEMAALLAGHRKPPGAGSKAAGQAPRGIRGDAAPRQPPTSPCPTSSHGCRRSTASRIARTPW